MKQQLVNQYLTDFVGRTNKVKVVEDAYKYLLEEKRKKLGYNPMFSEISIVRAIENDEIKSIGGSVPQDLILDNWGEFWSKHFRAPSTANADPVMVRTDGAVINSRVYGSTAYNSAFSNTGDTVHGGNIRMGQGSTPAARTDFELTSFLAAPEGNLVNAGPGGYDNNTGKIIVSHAAITAGANGSVNETGLYNRWKGATVPLSHTYMVFHDLISPGVNFLTGQNLVTNYVIQI